MSTMKRITGTEYTRSLHLQLKATNIACYISFFATQADYIHHVLPSKSNPLTHQPGHQSSHLPLARCAALPALYISTCKTSSLSVISREPDVPRYSPDCDSPASPAGRKLDLPSPALVCGFSPTPASDLALSPLSRASRREPSCLPSAAFPDPSSPRSASGPFDGQPSRSPLR